MSAHAVLGAGMLPPSQVAASRAMGRSCGDKARRPSPPLCHQRAAASTATSPRPVRSVRTPR